MKTAIAAIALICSLTAAHASYNITLECGDKVQRLQVCTASRPDCLAIGSRAFDRLSASQRQDCEVNVSRR